MYENVLEPLSIPQFLFSPQSKRRESPGRAFLQLIAILTQDHCSPWKKYNLFVPKSDSSANRNLEMLSLISDTHIFWMGIKNQVFGRKSNWDFHTHVHIHTHRDTHTYTHTHTHIHKHTHTHTHIHMHIHTNKHTHIWRLVVGPPLMQFV